MATMYSRLPFVWGTVFLLAGAVQAESSKLIRVPGPTVPGEYLVVLEPAAAKATLGGIDTVARALAARHGGQVVQTYRHALPGFLVRMPEGAARALSRDRRVRFVEENAIVSAGGAWSPLRGAMAREVQTPVPSWGLDRIDQRTRLLDNRYQYDFDGDNVHAYIIDTGIRLDHLDFSRVSWGVNTIDNLDTDCHGHGTHVAGTVGSDTYGVAKKVQLVAVKVLDCNGSGTIASVVAGIDWVTANHHQWAVATICLTTTVSQTLDTAVASSVAAGVFYAVAAGNQNANACNFSPARAASAYTVACSTPSDARCSFSNFGPCVDIFEPGQGITSTWSTSSTAINTLSGAHCGYTAGVAALVLDEFRTFTPAQVAQEITDRATCGVITNPGPGSPNLLLFSLNERDPLCP